MSIRLTGMSSGLDTDSMVKELVSAYSTKKDNIVKDKTKLEWKQEIWKDLNTKVYSFYTGSLSKLRRAASFTSKKSVSVSDERVAKITAGSNASNGSTNIEVKQLAKAQYYTSGKIQNKGGVGEVTSSSTVDSIVGANTGRIDITFTNQKDKDGNTVVKSIDYDYNDTIETITKKISDATGLKASFDEKNKRISIGGESGLENAFTITAHTYTEKDKADALEEARKQLEEEAINKALEAKKKTAKDNGEDESLVTLTDDEKQAAIDSVEDTAVESKVRFAVGDNLNARKMLAAFGLANEAERTELASLGVDLSRSSAVTEQKAADALVLMNGAEYTSSSNSIEIQGMTINALGEGKITANVETNTDDIYNMVKDFFKEYNSLITEMTKNYTAESSKGYEPLTDDEKEELSEKEIEKWEQKIKDSLLRRDSTLQGIMSTMTTALSQGVKVDGKTYYLSNFGISLPGYTGATDSNQNSYHIYGDSDDALYADNEDKLRKAINEDPELVQKFFNGLADSLYDNLHSKMLSTTMRSAYTVYNDKEMDTEMKDVKKKISDWEDKIKDYEDKWFKKFAAMEKAMTELDGKTQQLQSLLGQ